MILYSQRTFYKPRQSSGDHRGVKSSWNILFISGKVLRHSTGRLRTDFWSKNSPLPPLRTTHGAAIRKNLDEKDARDNQDFKTGSENVLAIMVRPQIEKEIRVEICLTFYRYMLIYINMDSVLAVILDTSNNYSIGPSNIAQCSPIYSLV